MPIMADEDGIGQSLVKRKSVATRLKAHFAEDIHESWTDLLLFVCCFLTGLLDSSVFNIWSCFVSMQTGNTIYVGLGVSGQPYSQPYRWLKSGTAIIAFLIGNYVFSRAHRAFNAKNRATVFTSFVFQATLIFVSAALVQLDIVPGKSETVGNGRDVDWTILLPLFLLSFQAAGQIVMSRLLEFGELTTVVLTSAYCDLMFDPHLFTAPITQDSKRNRRVISMILVVSGAIAGGFLVKDRSIALALWLAGAIKMAVALSWLFWRGKGVIRLD